MNTFLNLQIEFVLVNDREGMQYILTQIKGNTLLERIAARGLCEQLYVSPLLCHYHKGQTKRVLRRFKGNKYVHATPEFARAFPVK